VDNKSNSPVNIRFVTKTSDITNFSQNIKLWPLTRAAVKLSLFQDYNLSYSIPHRAKCRTEAVTNLSRSLETCKVPKNILSFIKKYQNQW